MPVVEQERLQTIGLFARAVGLSASALRQYGESGLLAPVSVEERTGYRYYALVQQQRAIWIRRLRDAGLRLELIKTVFESDVDSAEAVLDDWLADAQERSVSIEALVSDLKASLRAGHDRNPMLRTSARFDATVLASAIRSLRADTGERFAASDLDGVLIEIRDDSAGLVVTDRYVLLARLRVPAMVEGPAARVRISSTALTDWLLARSQVDLQVEVAVGRDESGRQARARFVDPQGEKLDLPQVPDLFPDVLQIINAARPSGTRVVFPRDELQRLSADDDARGILLTCEARSAHVTVGDGAISGRSTGAADPLILSAAAVRRIATAAVGEEIMCDIGVPGHPLAWRAPSQPDFIALMMPQSA
jgi:DNA-binding transcriptional MerR regulator